MPADPTVRVEYCITCSHGTSAPYESEADSRKYARTFDVHDHPCGPHRAIKRTISEEDVTDAE